MKEWADVERIYHAALARPPAERSAFLLETCAGDEALRREVESLLAHASSTPGALDGGAVAAAAGLVSAHDQSMLIGRRLGVYQITAPLGKGGMGEVYRARDTRLGRDVAIKILPRAFTIDAERLARFEREARGLASLNHPNIAAIYDVATSPTPEFLSPNPQSPNLQYLVLELVDGATLAEKLAPGSRLRGSGLRLDEALAIAKQVAEALEAAHDKGIIHRDLKPANIKITPTGVVKVLDFGLAKADPASGSGLQGSGLSGSPTITVGDTREGVILGTAAYMSPEQARGLVVDKRTDIWAFGCVLYEMLTGRRPFPGDDLSETLASVLAKEPDWSLLSAGTPSSLVRLIKRCLRKNPRERFQAIGDVRFDLDEITAIADEPAVATAAAASGRTRWLLIGACTAVVVLLATIAALVLTGRRGGRPVDAPEIRTEIVMPATNSPTSFALSPDGQRIVFVASAGGPASLWLRSLANTIAEPLPNTEAASLPFWKPDGRSIGFFADGKLKRLDLGGGAPQDLAAAPGAFGGTWNSEGVILFGASAVGPLLRVSATGGPAQPATKLEPSHLGHRLPWFLPDGRRFLFLARGVTDSSGLYLGSIDSGAVTRLFDTETGAVYLPSGWLLWGRSRSLVAQQFDPDRATFSGPSVTVADVGEIDSSLPVRPFSVSSNGLIAYRQGAAHGSQLQWLDRLGATKGFATTEGVFMFPAVAADGRRVLASRSLAGNMDIWLVDGARLVRLTSDAGLDRLPRWSRDGRRFIFDSIRDGKGRLYLGRVDSPNSETLLIERPQPTLTIDWSADDGLVAYVPSLQERKTELRLLSLEGDRPGQDRLCLTSQDGYPWGRLSPDGRWLAYESSRTGQTEIYIRRVTTPLATVADGQPACSASEWPASAGGGIRPAWRGDGRELYYLDLRGQMMAVAIAGKGDTPEPGAPVRLFSTAIYGGAIISGPQYDVEPNGWFLINSVRETSSPVTLLQNWRPPAK